MAPRSPKLNDADSALLNRIQAEVSERYPRIVLESVIQGWAYLAKFEEGIEAYSFLTEPSAADDRWLGVCYFQQFEDMRAQEAFFRALAKGEGAARVNLAHVLRFLERTEEAEQELSQVDVDDLRPYDKVLYFRVKSLHEESNGNVRTAVQFVERAWEQVQGVAEYSILAPSVLAQLGVLYARTGEARRALWYLELGIGLTTGLEQEKVRLRRATVLLSLGRFDEAAAELSALGDLPEALNLEREYLYGELHWYKGCFPEAISKFEAVIESGSRLAPGADEFPARIALTTLRLSQGEFDEAQEHLEQARILISDRTDVLVHRFRELLLHIARQDYQPTEAASQLEMLAVEFRRLGTVQEEACVRLHLASLYMDIADARLVSELSRIRDICTAINNSKYLQKEWALLPSLESRVHQIDPSFFDDEPCRVSVRTLGEEAIYLDGAPIRLPLRRSVEILAYFLEYGAVSLDQVIDELFPRVKQRTARSYFHQLRFQLSQSLPGIEISYDTQRRKYELKRTITLSWDVEQVRNGGPNLYSGVFLPQSNGVWIARIREELSDLVTEEFV